MGPLEIEVKFYLSDIDRMRDSIQSLGAEHMSSCLETNTCFDDEANSLTQGKKLLRLRQDTRCRLTVKTPADDTDSQFKMLQEMEVSVSDFQTMTAILEQLGYYPRKIYEKYRETYLLNHVELCLDTLPYGHFLEIEGEKKDIRQTTGLLGLDWNKKITANYLAIFAEITKQLNLPFEDITFKNFQTFSLNRSRIHQIIANMAS